MSYEKSSKQNDHAFLGASSWSWIYYDEEKLISAYNNFLAKERGTRLHDIASKLINDGITLPEEEKTLNMYVNDAIGFKMKTEQKVWYSDLCFGTADAICFRNKFLRIHDLKTGKTPAHMEQLYVYAAYYCLENRLKAHEIQIETRIYQNDEVLISNPDVTVIAPIMDKAVAFNKILHEMRRNI